MSVEDRVIARWMSAAARAGDMLEGWRRKHPIILQAIAPLLPEIIKTLQSGDIDRIEALLKRSEG
jgi:hypothetical protein